MPPGPEPGGRFEETNFRPRRSAPGFTDPRSGAPRRRVEPAPGGAPVGERGQRSTAQPPYASEVPINLPANRQDPEYGSDVVVDMLGALGFDYIALTPGSSFRGIHDSLVNYGRNHRP